MSKEKLGQDPAYPCKVDHWEVGIKQSYNKPGMSTRLVIASKIAAGLASSEIGIGIAKISERVPKNVKIAYEYADELLRQENESS